MINFSDLYQNSRKRLEQVRDLIARLEKNLAKAPEGSIRYIQRNGNIQYYLRMKPQEKSGRYLRRSETETIRTYLQKAYDKKALKLLRKEERVLILLQREEFGNCRKNLQNLYSGMPEEIRKPIEPLDVANEDYARIWMSQPFEGKAIDADSKIYQTDNGEHVRSKSELTIANALNKHGIPYKYECPLELKGGFMIYPDFTVLNVRSREVFYWEHRGMMDDRGYAQNAVKRNKDYIRAGIIIGKKLIITEETSVSPLSTYEIETIIKQYFV